MYQHTGSSNQPKRRKKRPIHGVKTVDVTRGKSGYGFTISGQHPCILSCIVSGSPADSAGLKAGDYLVSVNGLNISKALHDDVVRMVGMSTGTLTLQVAENYNSSDSSDEEYHHRSKARYPNRVRPRHASSNKHGEKVLTECNQRDRHSSNERHKHSHRSNHDSYNKLSQSGPRLHTPVGAENNLSGSSHNSTPQFAGPLNVEKRRDNPTLNGNSTSAINHPLAKQAIVKSTLSSSQSKSSTRPVPSGSVSNHRRDCINRSNNLNASYVTPAVSSYLKTSASTTQDSSPNNAFIAMEEEDDDMGDDEASLLDRSIHDMRAVVGYIGSIEMPSDANKPHVRLQSIRNAVRRLRVEQKIHTLVLMEVSSDGVKLTNAMATTVAHYPVDRLAFSGVCPDDKRFFGIVTLHSFVNDEASSDNGNQNESASSGSCHVFMVDPEMRSHNIHSQKAKTFGITCTPTPDQNQCSEFPKSATPIILSITNLYKNRPGTACLDNEVALSQAFADPSRAAQRSCSNSSNSDSGLGFSKDDQTGERVCVIDMPQGAVAAPVVDVPKSQEEWSGQSMTLSSGPIQHCSPGIRTIPTPLHSSYRPVSDVRSRLDASTSSEDSSFFKHTSNDKLNVRAMPGPLNGVMPPPSAFDPFDRHSADSLRASTHRLYQNRQQKIINHTNSDQESNTSHGSDICRSFSHPDLQRSTSAPFKQLSEESFMGHYNSSKVEAIDMDDSKLSPRAFLPPPFHQLRSPSAPPMINGRSSDAESDVDMADTSIVSNLVDQFGRAQAFNFNSPADGRRFSESFAVLRKVSVATF
ncbi:hypothetical protein KUTeg_005093 [Tegillarca granosa]|uniref:Regulator of G-protein signaling 12 n=1 Tax=Tegillarca granosa TaxID=220873 RepID=A0ABQ9FIT8_TEGGR|nr:hypothetical protein KUTeg_005093 [Tegillarca granosa]